MPKISIIVIGVVALLAWVPAGVDLAHGRGVAIAVVLSIPIAVLPVLYPALVMSVPRTSL